VSDLWRVYVSAFLDWPRTPEEAPGFDAWRCMDNSSGYLLIGRWHPGRVKPDPTRGSLPRTLRRIRRTRDGRPIHWTFDVLPTRWGAAEAIPSQAHDVIVSLGLGVYRERYGEAHERTVIVELGARNLRARGPDVAGVSIGDDGAPGTVIDPKGKCVLHPRAHTRRRARDAAATVETTYGSFSVITEAARDENAFICNETHYRLIEQAASGERPRHAYFIHLPRPRNMRRGRPLARVLRRVIEGLIQP
jgi:hypothetical protein